MTGLWTPITSLSGGNQQKVVFARWLEAGSSILILDNPTQGIDVGAKAEIYRLIMKMADDGKSVMVLTSEAPEILKVCDRVVIMYHGRVAAILDRSQATEEVVMMHVARNLHRRASHEFASPREPARRPGQTARIRLVLTRVRQNSVVAAALRFLEGHSVIVAFLVIVIISALAAPDRFLSQSNIINVLRQASIEGIISLGQTLVIVSGGIDLSVGSGLAIVGAGTIFVLNLTKSIPLGILAAVACGLAAGAVNGLIITKGRVTPFIVTLGTWTVFRSLSLYALNGGDISANVPHWEVIANGGLFGVSYPVFYFVILTAVVFVFSQKTRTFRHMYAIGSNERATRLSAVNVDRVKLATYMVCGLLVACSSIIETSRLNSISAASSGINYELDSIAAVIIGGARLNGGRGTVIGTFFGVLILSVLSDMLILLGVSPFLAGTVKGLIIIVSVLIQRRE